MGTNRVRAFREWLAKSRPGAFYNYFTGYLATARGEYISVNGDLLWVPNVEIDDLATTAIDAWNNGRVHLFQRKLHDHEYEYLAVKRYQPAVLWTREPERYDVI